MKIYWTDSKGNPRSYAYSDAMYAGLLRLMDAGYITGLRIE